MMPSPPKRRQPLVQSRPVHRLPGRERSSIRFTVSVHCWRHGHKVFWEKNADKAGLFSFYGYLCFVKFCLIVDVIIIIIMDGRCTCRCVSGGVPETVHCSLWNLFYYDRDEQVTLLFGFVAIKTYRGVVGFLMFFSYGLQVSSNCTLFQSISIIAEIQTFAFSG